MQFLDLHGAARTDEDRGDLWLTQNHYKARLFWLVRALPL
jgi:hypothetical protein